MFCSVYLNGFIVTRDSFRMF